MSDLVLITLPIGNVKDITLRALETLKQEQVFFAEDTRVFKQYLDSQGISLEHKKIDSFHDQSVGKIELIISLLKSGQKVCLVSDAGSPVISDPAYPLLKRCLEEKIEIKTIPGVTSVITALELSALPPHPFHFWGFLGRTTGERMEFFTELKSIYGTHIFFESPHRIYETVKSFFDINPDSMLVITRELTKTYESVYRLTKENLSDLQSLIVDKGEFVVLFHQDQHKGQSAQMLEVQTMIRDYLENGGGPKKLAKIFAKATGGETKVIYDQLSRSGRS